MPCTSIILGHGARLPAPDQGAMHLLVGISNVRLPTSAPDWDGTKLTLMAPHIGDSLLQACRLACLGREYFTADEVRVALRHHVGRIWAKRIEEHLAK